MKRTVVVLASALVLALAAPMAFAASIDISGQAETRFEYSQDQTTNEWGMEAVTGLKLSPTLRVGDHVELGVEVKTHDDEFNTDGEPIREFHEGHKPFDPAITKVWLKTTGPFWQGGPELTTTIGDNTVRWNDWIAYFGPAQRSVTVEGMDLMVADADAFFVWNENAADRTFGLRLGSEYAGVDMDGALVYENGKVNTALGAATNLDGIELDGVVAMDDEFRYAFKVNASMSPMEDVTLRAGYRQMHADFAPMHARENSDGFIVPFHKASHDAGFDLGVETVYSGFALGATYDQPTNEAGVSAARTFDVYDHAIDTKYEATFTPGEPILHELSASTTTDAVPYVPGIGLSAKVGLEGTDFSNVSYELNSTYTAPNGISLGAGYSSDAGAVLSGGLKVQF